MSPIRVNSLLRRLTAATCLALASCTYRSDHDDDGGYVAPPYDTWEIEPNDSAWNPDAIGPLAVGDGLIIGGHVTEFGADLFDGFAFQSVQPCDIEFTLVAQDLFADLDLCVYDPQLGDYSFCFESAGNVEKGVFSVPFGLTDFHLVVYAYDGPSEYRLEVVCAPITLFTANAAAAPAPESDRAPDRERYFEREAAPSATPRVVARGVLLEIEVDSGEVREADFEVLAGSD